MDDNNEIIIKLSVPTFILLGLAKSCSYYNHFHLPIVEYLNFTEMITIFLSNLYVYFSLAFHFAIFFLIEKKHFRASLSLVILGSIFIATYNGLSGNFNFDISNILLVITGMLFIAFFIIGISKSWIIDYLETLSTKTKKYIVAIFTILVFLVISSFQGLFEAQNVKSSKIYTGTTISLKDKNIESDDSFYFIGKTNEYIFFYDQKSDYVKTFPLSEVNEIVYKVKHKY